MKKLRSHEWFVRSDKMGFMYRSWIKNQGWPGDLFEGRPVIGICNTWSELTPCNAHFREIAEWVKKGVWEMGGFPLEFPVMSLGEVLLRPTAMLFRNLASMDVEESIRGNPLDGVVLLMGCDKTTPSLLMGAASCDLPTIGLSGGPMLSGKFHGHDLGSGTGVWQMSEKVRSGEMPAAEFFEAESCMHRSKGHCMTMGTASTMASMVEALGMSLPGNAAIPAVDARRYTLAQLTGRRIVEMVKEDLRMSKILTRKAFENAIRTNAAIGGSTNAVIHLLAIAGRIGVPLKLEDFDKLGSELPCLLNLQPSGSFLMEDFFYAGGLPAILREMGESGALERDALTVNGKTIWENVADAPCWKREVIHEFKAPFKEHAGIAVLRGNLAPDGAVIKPSAASPHLLKHRVRAEGLSRDGGGGKYATAAQGFAPRHHGYGANFGCTNERDRVWDRCAAYIAGGGGWRNHCPGENGRFCHAGRARQVADVGIRGCGVGAEENGMEGGAIARAWVVAVVRETCVVGERRSGFGFSCGKERGGGAAG